MKNTEIKKLIKEMIKQNNEDELRKELEFRVMSCFRDVAVPFKDKTAKPSINSIIRGLEDTIKNFKEDNQIN